jgi:hypothetical protein
MKQTVVFSLIAIGLLLLVVGSIWKGMFTGATSWTPEKDDRWSEVKKRLHVLRFTVGSAEANPSMHGGPDLAKAKAELHALKEESDRLTAEFDGIRERPNSVAKILKWTGISLTVVGLIGWYAVKQSS